MPFILLYLCSWIWCLVFQIALCSHACILCLLTSLSALYTLSSLPRMFFLAWWTLIILQDLVQITPFMFYWFLWAKLAILFPNSLCTTLYLVRGFPGSLAGKEFACSAGDHHSIPWLGRFPGEGISCPLQYSWASLAAQMMKNLPAVQETWVKSLGWEDLLKESMVTHYSIFAWRIPMDRGAWRATVHEVTKSWAQLSD